MGSVIFLMIYIVCLTGLQANPAIKKCKSGAVSLILANAMLLWIQMLAGACCLLLGIQNILLPTGILLSIIGVLAWYPVLKSRDIARHVWIKSEIAGVLLITAVTILVTVHMFGWGLKLQYANLQAAEHFNDIMKYIRGAEQTQVGLSGIFQILVIEWWMPFFPAAKLYKAYILANFLIQLTEGLLFYAVILLLGKKKIIRYLAPMVTIAYLFGYPFYFYLTGGVGSLSLRNSFLLSLLLCYQQMELAKGHRMGRPVTIRIWAAGAAVLAAVLLLYQTFGSGAHQDTVFASMYGELIFFVPAVIYAGAILIRKKDAREAADRLAVSMMIGAFAATIIAYISWNAGWITNDNYYQNYAMLWLFGWLAAVFAFRLSAERKELVPYLSYTGMIAILAILVLSGTADKIASSAMDLNYVTKGFFSLYRYNQTCINEDYTDYEVWNREELALINEMEQKKEKVPVLTESRYRQVWYDALTGNESEEFLMNQTELPEMIKKLDENRITGVLFVKDEVAYQQSEAFFDAYAKQEENETLVCYENTEHNWSQLNEEQVDLYEEKTRLYEEAQKESSQYGTVPLLASKESIGDFILYEDITGKDVAAFYTWNYNARENIENLNEHHVKMITLLKNDPYYLTNRDYFERYDVIFENQAGLIVYCAQNQWYLD